MDIKPILATLTRHRVSALLITLEIALACAVLCNALFLAVARIDLIGLDSGVDEASLATLALNDCEGCNAADINGRWLDLLRRQPGVQAAGVVNSVPFAQRAGVAGVTLDAEGKHFGGVPHFYTFDPGAIQALGLRPVRGRAFTAADHQPIDNFLPANAQVWITRDFAEHLWPGEDPLGREFWMSNSRLSVAGIVEHFARPDPGRSEDGIAAAQWSVIVPVTTDAQSGTYVVRADPRDLPGILGNVIAAAPALVPEAILNREYSRTLADLRHAYFAQDRAMTRLLLGVCLAMLLVTALGIVGLASFWVQQRTKQIGIRRALGATRRQVVAYFQTENLLLTAAGIVLGMLLAYGGNQLLMRYFEIARLPLPYLPIGALALFALGQAAVIGPALRAAAVPPIVATRST
ncbi:FtsX-like permease family protein [Flavobacterium sp. MXW15]|uniref:FtsX-like permease family protein n=1 Tax=Xanthomonas chitinilytica TaxID=2989819 RepID=A0ABT3JTA2_9XANT|nr:FtsX-like permease family protein [Xanthomonas sp. H13-6]MCW4454489.1 FtsX-like permease family protein [Flavobacterium sp. MXW15]MCW4471728.1 FtsX-like permease family protein [Xanthomonas sp. H13-6]